MTLEDLRFLAHVAVDIGRYREAITTITNAITLSPSIDSEFRSLFQTAFKHAADDHRKNLRLFYQRRVAEEDNPRVVARLDALRASELSALSALTAEAAALIDRFLLPASADSFARVSFWKIRGDLSRYVCEFADGEALQAARAEAETAYTAALEAAERDLAPQDPVRLAAVLNCAVFKFEHLDLFQEAAELLQGAVGAARGDLSEDARDILAVMATNLDNWGKAALSEEEETSEEEE
jgi:hypothetical protein